MNYFIGMDVGGTSARLKLADESGKVLGEYTGQGCTLITTSFDYVLTQFRTVIEKALGEHRLTPQTCLGLCIGAAGIDTEEQREQYTQIFEAIGFDRKILKVYNDCELLLYVYPEQACMAIVAGTGSIIIGKDSKNNISRYGGWSHILSDEGSAFYIIRNAMESILRYMDGYGDCRVLTELFIKESGLGTPYDIAAFVYENIMQKSRIARFAPVVDKAAEQGDAAALDILNKAALSLFWGGSTVAKAIAPVKGEPLTVIFWGSVLLNSSFVANELKRLFLAQYPQVNIVLPDSSALDIALGIAVKSGR